MRVIPPCEVFFSDFYMISLYKQSLTILRSTNMPPRRFVAVEFYEKISFVLITLHVNYTPPRRVPAMTGRLPEVI